MSGTTSKVRLRSLALGILTHGDGSRMCVSVSGTSSGMSITAGATQDEPEKKPELTSGLVSRTFGTVLWCDVATVIWYDAHVGMSACPMMGNPPLCVQE